MNNIIIAVNGRRLYQQIDKEIENGQKPIRIQNPRNVEIKKKQETMND